MAVPVAQESDAAAVSTEHAEEYVEIVQQDEAAVEDSPPVTAHQAPDPTTRYDLFVFACLRALCMLFMKVSVYFYSFDDEFA